jgi:hypothetical protein
MRSKSLGTLYKLKKVYESISELDGTDCEMPELKQKLIKDFNEWKLKTEELPIIKDNLSIFSPYYVLIDNKWNPVISAIENINGGLAWSMKEGENVVNDTSKAGQWASVGAGNHPFIELNFTTLLKLHGDHIIH